MVTQNMVLAHEAQHVFSREKIRFLNDLDLIMCLKQIK